MQPILTMENITKRFPGVIANDGVNFDLQAGEIHALVGENGAGKSTLMNVLFGLYQPEEGKIAYKGEELIINEPTQAIKLGIGMVHQHFKLVQPLTVTENIILGSEPTLGIKINKEKALKDVDELSKKYGLIIDPKAKIENITVGMQQRVEILKTLYRGADIIILDEPTAVLTPQEVKELFAILKGLTDQGKSIIFITHKLNEVMEIADRATVMRRGKTIGTVSTKETSPTQLAEMMVGRQVLLRVEKQEAKLGKEVLKVEGVSGNDDRNLQVVDNVSLSIRAGEILGIAGVEGNGQSELIEILTGLRKPTSGDIYLNDKKITGLTAREIKNSHVGYIPEDRHKRGLILDFSISENAILGIHQRKPFAKGMQLNLSEIKKHADNLIEKYDIRTPNREVHARNLSGGNQQKIIIARELEIDPVLIIASQPTRGVDIGAIEFIHKQIIEARDEGKAVLLVSAELQEILSLSDRIAVIYEGEIVDIIDAKEATEEKLGLLMAGVRN
ncbi:ABC transporter ATP-binding protein [Alkaliphilus transvaalensis]|uniref:ABC transporter ATP-binding protein n=1 Tax=Alkaliphilus transvaalensis TaxID=114628 RepID=UPI00047C6EFD|nr:ABC transporter ATP-binding protein [Alkaliphilus transvaalensis]